jgi:TolB-like protein/Tfp pilus assembly protein PilF
VTEISLDRWSESDQKAIREQLVRILNSGPFQQSQRRQRFLEYLVNETLAGRGERLKGYNVALEVFDRPETFDPILDPVVRIEAGRLREKLREYYDADGQSDPIRIDLPKGTYTPRIEFRQSADRADATTQDRPPYRSGGPVATQPPSRNRPLGFLAASLVVVLLALLAGFAAWRSWTPSTPLSEKASIAVLPFENIGNDPEWDHFADGITEDIVTDLSHSKDLFVVARNSTEVYRGKPADMRSIGRDLGVRYVLEGSIQPSGDQIRVTAQLIDTRTGGHVWSDRYDRPATDLFNVQSDVTGKIAATLSGYEGAVAEAERSLIRRKPPSDLTAYENYLLGMEAKHGGGAGGVTKKGLEEAERLFRKAIEIDPQFARAYVGLAWVQFYLIDLGLVPSVEEAVSKMMEATEKAVELDPNDGEAHLALGNAYAYQGKREQAAAEYAKAEMLAPSNADLLLIAAWAIVQLGEKDRAVSLAERALKLNPYYPDWYNQGLSVVFFFGEQYDKSVKYRLLVNGPHALDYAYLAMANAYLGRTDDAEAAAANVIKLDPTWIAERYLSEAGGFAERQAELFVYGARKAGVPDCVSADKLTDTPNLIHVPSCDQQRAKMAG